LRADVVFAISQYWSQRPEIRGYLYDQGYGSGQAGFCSKATNLAATQNQLLPNSITVCPKGKQRCAKDGMMSSFLTPMIAGWGSAANTPYPAQARFNRVAPRSVAATPQASVPAPTAGQDLAALMPTAATLFHELFHLILGNANSYLPGGGEEYDLFGCVGLAFAGSIRNPESFTFAAVAYDYTLNGPTVTTNGVVHRLEFFTGYTTQG
jgi:hypothetical protein